MSEALLRGAVAALEQDGESLNFFRILHEDSEGEHSHSAGSDSSRDEKHTFIMFVTVAVGLVVYMFCMVQMVRTCFSRRHSDSEEDQGSVLVRDGLLFNLTTRQRRAVLEAIFSESSKVSRHVVNCCRCETRLLSIRAMGHSSVEIAFFCNKLTRDNGFLSHSQAVTKYDLPTKKLKTTENDKPAKDDDAEILDITKSSTKETLDISEDDVVDLEANDAALLTPVPSLTTGASFVSSPEYISSSAPDTPCDVAAVAGDDLEVTNQGTPKWQEKSPGESDLRLPMPISSDGDALYLPSLSEEECKVEEKCKEEEVAEIEALPDITSMASMDSIAENSSNDYYDEEDDNENLCAICLANYREFYAIPAKSKLTFPRVFPQYLFLNFALTRCLSHISFHDSRGR